jgi:hypothetical protein
MDRRASCAQIERRTTAREPMMDARRVNDFLLQSQARDGHREAAIDFIVWGIVVLLAIGLADVVTMLSGRL